MEARWFEQDGLLVFRIKADRFLRNMVRAIVGTLLEIGKGRMTLEEFCAVIEHKDRCEAGTSVPAHALFLEEVEYKAQFCNNNKAISYQQSAISFATSGLTTDC